MNLDWSRIHWVLLDMDGTLLDLHFDNHFWLQHVPLRYAAANNLPLEEARQRLLGWYKEAEGSLDWYCLDYWSERLGMDIALLKHEVDHLIAVHPFVTEFLDAVRAGGRRAVLVTNAHAKSLRLKMSRTALGGHLDRVITSHDLGLPKEDPELWARLKTLEHFDPTRTLLIDDSLPVLRSARTAGIAFLLGVRRPDTRQGEKDSGEFSAIASFREIVPPTAAPSRDPRPCQGEVHGPPGPTDPQHNADDAPVCSRSRLGVY